MIVEYSDYSVASIPVSRPTRKLREGIFPHGLGYLQKCCFAVYCASSSIWKLPERKGR